MGDSPAPFGARVLGPSHQSPRQLRLRVQVLLTVMLVSTNVVAAGIVFVISFFVIPSPTPTTATLVSLAIAVPTYVAVAVVIGVVVGTRLSLRALRWAMEDRDPEREQRLTALRVPVRLTVLQGLLWLAAVLLFGTLAVVLQPERTLGTVVTVAIAGLVACGIAFLFAEFTLRPVAARALADLPVRERPRGAGVGGRMVIFWCLGTGAPVIGLGVAAVLALVGDDMTLTRLAVTTLVICGVVLVFGLLTTVLNARSVVAPVVSVRDALLDVERGDLDRTLAVYDGTELGSLQSGFNSMARGLREREHLRDLFGRHVGHEVAAAAAAGQAELGGEVRVVSVLFVDLVGSTTYATEHDPAQVVGVLNRFFGVVVDEVDRHGGLVNKFIGDAVLAIFGAPVDHPDHATAALRAARTMAARLAEEVPEIGAGIGVATGEAVAGNVGSRSRFEYTVIGDAVNTAARLTDLAKREPGCVLATLASVEAADVDEAARWRRHGSSVLRGRTSATETAVPSDG
ncbi:adenylate/guanylate cyclase domain-containing protein [Nocardioides sp. SYSU DS0663]|uniref:adenylate/guanylate cyclase domain-containing protein n=1 Tax=Nocardioides sp. SYSU DS0663 TaxID=3416445 RepID=UPI003F4B4F84